MPDIRYVCLSDVHFGAESSLLTFVEPGSVKVDPRRPSPVMTALSDCLDVLISANQGGRKPSLVLCGDILELALATDNVAAMVFDRFVEAVFAQERRLFDDTVYFVPGNHDHHLWEGARERQYADYLRARPLEDDLEVPWHTTRMFTENDPQPVDAELLTTLVRRHPHLRDVSVRAVYPNLGLASADGSRCVVFHHGHFVETMYRLMSVMKDMVFPGRPPRPDVWDWEAENFAWIDFFWSTLGRSGEVGTDVGLVYECFKSDRAMSRLSANLAHGLTAGRRGPRLWRETQELAVRLALRQLVRSLRRLERSRTGSALSGDAERGLRAYLEGPLRRQLVTERGGMPEHVSFVFGHTHKPFETRLWPSGYASPVDVYNTGGWAVDSLAPEPLQGASAVLLDEHLNVVSLRLFNQDVDPSAYSVRLAGGTTGTPVEDPFLERLAAIVDPGKEPWLGFSRSTATLVAQRHRESALVIDRVMHATSPN